MSEPAWERAGIAYRWRHTVGFEETNLIGNVYFTNYLLWQGHCRERFLADHAPGVLPPLLSGQLSLFTRHCSCDYLTAPGFLALDEVEVAMTLESFRGGRMSLGFAYALAKESDRVVARGEQQLACLARRGDQWVPAPFPSSLVRPLKDFAGRPELIAALDDTLEFLGERGEAS